MATINPNTTVKLFSGVPLDNTYEHTLYFDTLAAQTTYFNSLTPSYTFTNNMYQRVNDGVFEAGCSVESIYRCNYMMFQNTGFENKWFYAFITSVDYVNNNNCRVHFEIDVMQTWMFDITVKRCFIERQHSVGDAIGSNILPEPVSLGEYVYDGYDYLTSNYNRYAILIMIVNVEAGQTTNGVMIDNVYSGAELYAVDAETTTPTGGAAASVNNFLAERNPKPEQVIQIYMCPLHLLPIRTGTQDQETSYDQVAAVPGGAPASYMTVTRSAVTSFTTIDGYTPKNKKLFTYPYNFYHVDNGDGAGLDLRYEFFTNYTPAMRIEGCIAPPVQLRLTPYNYKGGVSDDRAEFITISGYPVCSWNYDTYRAWAAQNSIPMEIAGAMSIAGVALAGVTGGASLALTAGVGALSTAVSAVSQVYQASQKADVCKGNVNSGNVNFAHKKQNFYGSRCHITADYAAMIDNFFTMFGYAYNKIGVPNTHSRPHWNYVKTNGANIIGNCPNDDLSKIKSIYDKGVTFWKSASEVGNYNLDNSPVTNP